MDWFQIGKGVGQGCILSPCLFNLYWVHHAKCQLNESQAEIKIARRNIIGLRYVDDTTLITERRKELKCLLIKIKEEGEKAVLKFKI